MSKEIPSIEAREALTTGIKQHWAVVPSLAQSASKAETDVRPLDAIVNGVSNFPLLGSISSTTYGKHK